MLEHKTSSWRMLGYTGLVLLILIPFLLLHSVDRRSKLHRLAVYGICGRILCYLHGLYR